MTEDWKKLSVTAIAADNAAVAEYIAQLEANLSTMTGALQDNVKVHRSILMGTIALTKAQAIHIAGLPADIEDQLATMRGGRDTQDEIFAQIVALLDGAGIPQTEPYDENHSKLLTTKTRLKILTDSLAELERRVKEAVDICDDLIGFLPGNGDVADIAYKRVQSIVSLLSLKDLEEE